MKRLSLLIPLVAASQLGATDCGTVIEDPGFDVWCGESLCSWKLLRGDIDRVGTWHEGDSGVAFLGTDTAIQQVAPVNSFDGKCIRFSMITDVAENAEVFLDIDVEADGIVERTERIGTSHWKPVSFLIHIAPPYDGIRFELAKHGTGTAVLANIGAELSDECAGLPQIEVAPRPNGASCNDVSECASGICVATFFGNVCAGCDPALGTAACTGGEVCGVGSALSPVLAPPLVCVPAASHELAEQCVSDAECASGKCASGVCSTCKTTADCDGQSCGPSWRLDNFFQTPGPSVCQPGEGALATGAGCGSDADCASGTCAGDDRKTCDDGRACTADTNCPANSDLSQGACTTVGVQGGSCT